MATVDITDWREPVANYVKTVDNGNYDALLDDEIRETLRDFCEHTHLWTYRLPRIKILEDVTDYVLDTTGASGSNEIVMVESVQYKDPGMDDDQMRPLIPMTGWIGDDSGQNSGRSNDSSTPASPGNWRYVKGDPTRYHVDAFKLFHIFPIPREDSDDDGLQVTTVLKPDDDATEVPIWIYQDYKKAITWGVTSRLLGMTTQNWFNLQLSDYYWNKYFNRRQNAALQKQMGFTRRDLKVQIPYFGGSRAEIWIF